MYRHSPATASASLFTSKSIQAILFDLDGTLIDTDDQAVERLSGCLTPIMGRNSARAARWLLMQSETPGNYMVSLLDKIGLDVPVMTFTDKLRRKRGVYMAEEFRLIRGVDKLIPKLQQRYKLGIVTSRSRYHIEQFMRRFPALAGAFAVSVGMQDTDWLKPNPQPVYLAARVLKVPTANCLFVGDTTVDIKAGRRAGTWTVGVLCGFGQRSELERAGAHHILESTADLPRIL